MIVRRALTLLAALAVAAPAEARIGVGWVRADGPAHGVSRSLHWPGNLLDANPKTVFCVGGGARGASGRAFTIGFRGKGRITELEITTGDTRTRRRFAAHNRVKTLVLHEGDYKRELTLDDVAKPQTVKLSPPIRSDQVTFEITAVYGHSKTTCLADVVFRSGRHPLSGRWMARYLRYHRSTARVLGVWAAGPKGAPERFLSLYLDGTFRWAYSPNDPDQRGAHLRGRWRVRGRRLVLEARGRRHAVHLRLKRSEDDNGEPLREIVLGKARGLPKRLPGTYRDRWL